MGSYLLNNSTNVQKVKTDVIVVVISPTEMGLFHEAIFNCDLVSVEA